MDLKRHQQPMGDKPALILVDMINGFTSADCPLGTHCPSVVSANKRLLDTFRRLELPIFFTTVVYDSKQQAKVFRNRIPDLDCLARGTHWCEVDPNLKPLDGESLIEKQWASAFFKTDLASQLESHAADSLVITGLTTSGCVRATVVDGLQHDYTVFVVEEAVGDRNTDAHRANLHDMHAKYADVLSLESLEEKLSRLVLSVS